jgi:inhibitor of cysteine peptidase
MNKRASRSVAILIGVAALAMALVAMVAAGCGSSTDDTNGADTTVTLIDGTATTDGATGDTSTDDSTADDTTPDTSAAAAAAATLALTKDDNGKSFDVKVGDTISVVLEGNATTGYMWQSAMPEQASPLVTLNNGEGNYTQDSVPSGTVGAGGMYTFIFTAVAAGQVQLELKYWRPFEPQSEPLETFSVTLNIK